jgi:hypothetical protein
MIGQGLVFMSIYNKFSIILFDFATSYLYLWYRLLLFSFVLFFLLGMMDGFIGGVLPDMSPNRTSIKVVIHKDSKEYIGNIDTIILLMLLESILLSWILFGSLICCSNVIDQLRHLPNQSFTSLLDCYKKVSHIKRHKIINHLGLSFNTTLFEILLKYIVPCLYIVISIFNFFTFYNKNSYSIYSVVFLYTILGELGIISNFIPIYIVYSVKQEFFLIRIVKMIQFHTSIYFCLLMFNLIVLFFPFFSGMYQTIYLLIIFFLLSLFLVINIWFCNVILYYVYYFMTALVRYLLGASSRHMK